MDKEKPLGEYEVTPSGMGGIISLTKNEVYLTSCPVRVYTLSLQSSA